jgi:hypothetical protein
MLDLMLYLLFYVLVAFGFTLEACDAYRARYTPRGVT